MEKILSLSLAFIMMICSVTTAFAVESGSGKCGENLNWSFVGGVTGTLSIEGNGKMDNYSSDNPAPWESFAGNVYHLSLSKNIESIGNYAFSGFANFNEEIVLPNCLNEIGEGAFEGSAVTKVTIPYTVKKIAKNTFKNCENLESVVLNTVRIGSDNTGYTVEGTEEIGESAFEYCTSLKTIKLPECLLTIGNNAFIDNSSLEEITFGGENNIKNIGESAFSYCSSLKSFSVSEKISEIKESTFEACYSLKNIVLPKNVKSIGKKAFADCLNLDYIYIKDTACKLYDADDTIDDSAEIRCHAKSLAKAYANKYSKKCKVYCITTSSNHLYNKVKCVVKATTKDGRIDKECISCGDIHSSVISRIRSITLSKTAYTYNGKTQRPTVKVLDGNGKIIPHYYYDSKKNKVYNYALTYSSSSSKYVNKYKVTIVFKGNYSGTFYRYYTIYPKGTKISKVTSGAGKLGVYWSKQTSQTSGYQIQLCKYKNFSKSVKTITYRNVWASSYTVKSLSRNTGYYIRIRTFKTVGKANYYSGWSALYGRKTK